jgi:ribosome maturation factor RimP
MATNRQGMVELLEPVVTGLGFELVDLELHQGRSRGLLRLYIDHPGGITVDHCETVSRQVSAVLDVADPLASGYTLEVSSPGLDRRLAKATDFDRYAGAEVQLKLRRLVEGRRRIRGTLLTRVGESIEVQSDGVMLRIPLAEVDVARLVPDLRIPARTG